MRLNDIYALPTRRTRPWHDDTGSTQRLFGYQRAMGEFDVTLAETEKADDLVFLTKLDRYVGQDASLGFQVAEFRGRPFGLIVSAGEDGESAFVTDPVIHGEARNYVEAYREFGKPEVVDPDEDRTDLDALYGHTVMPLRGRLEFVGQLRPPVPPRAGIALRDLDPPA